jgi:HlyD family secretion protein
MKRRTLTLLVLVATATISVGAYYAHRGDPAPILTTDAATRGDVVTVVAATGTLQAVTTVEVGSQVSGIIEKLGADYNSLVHRGDMLVTLEQSDYKSAVEQASAELVSAQADAERLRVADSAAQIALERARELSVKELETAEDLETTETDARSASSMVIGADAKTEQARAGLKTAQVNLEKTVIASPIDGVVIARNIDIGQTVSASFSAPTLFVIAADLTKLQVNTNVDESDLGNVQAGQPVTFRVDAYPTDTFRGVVSQVRLNPTTVQNVVTYSAIIDAPNPALKLKPGMTANVTIEVARSSNVLRVPVAALRFKPDASLLARYGVAAPKPQTAIGKTGTVWISNGTSLSPVTVTTGLSDATQTEIAGTPFEPGTLVVTRASSPSTATAAAPAATGNPLLPAQRGPGLPGAPRPAGR